MKMFIFAVILFASVSPAISALADNTTSENSVENTTPVNPCEKIRQTCMAGGYVKDGANNENDLVVNCVNPLMHGENVPGVTIDQATIQDCRKILKRHPHRQKHIDRPVR
jgi:hypothetical protein